ncbi:cyclopropane-fatty-acyl-phospholipid synthase family protein [Streptomyces sp. TBY4]|uniref:SAM-dependent methyltransferase n=1 Tax=Streptomyces sp. TBY4 TaxID=2962030 RepID=UPI0020B732F4|nr:class I SAM-dependent methyltransferase [Streptomyces sp. TBY4]MCP3757261.1 class I SAM-dependent methyltransferase [Streptomyces sp. TBY4]
MTDATTTPMTGAGTTAATNRHYDLHPDVFALFLDPRLKYSSGRYAPEDTLEAAQTRKLHFVAGQLGLKGGEKLLDVGCGWGSLALFMAKEYGCQVVGISPAGRQRAYVEEHAARWGVDITLRDGLFERTDFGSERFDALTMLGSIVHMPDLTAVYAKARTLLRPGGTVYVSETCFRNTAAYRRFQESDGASFVRNDIFGFGDMRPLSQLVAAAEDAGLSVIGVTDLTDDYRRTIEHWLENVRRNADRIDAVQPGGTSARLARYLQVANAGWGYTTKHYALVARRTR